MSKYDIKISLKSFEPYDGLKRGRLNLLISGNDSNLEFVNALGRIAMKRVPTYAFARELIDIKKINPESGYHDSVPFNYDMIKLRIKNTPVVGVDPNVSYLHEKYWKNMNYLNNDRDKYETEKQVEINIDVKNDEEDIIHVTTNDMKIYVDNELKELYNKKYPFLLISLKPKEAFNCSLKAVLGVGLNDDCWNSAGNYWYDVNDDGSIDFFVEGNLCFNELKLISRSLEYFKLRVQLLKDEVLRQYLIDPKKSNKFQVKIIDEDHTIGSAINYELQSHKDIIKSSIVKPTLLVREIIIDIFAPQDKMKNSFLESFDNLLSKINYFEKQYKKIEN